MTQHQPWSGYQDDEEITTPDLHLQLRGSHARIRDDSQSSPGLTASREVPTLTEIDFASIVVTTRARISLVAGASFAAGAAIALLVMALS